MPLSLKVALHAVMHGYLISAKNRIRSVSTFIITQHQILHLLMRWTGFSENSSQSLA